MNLGDFLTRLSMRPSATVRLMPENGTLMSPKFVRRPLINENDVGRYAPDFQGLKFDAVGGGGTLVQGNPPSAYRFTYDNADQRIQTGISSNMPRNSPKAQPMITKLAWWK